MISPEQLTQIQDREVVAQQAMADGTYGRQPETITGLSIHEALDYISESARDVPDLIAELKRLQIGIKALAAPPKSGGHRLISGRDLLALLNPPTQGDH